MVANDIKDVFLKEYAVVAIYKSNNSLKEITIQFFGQPLDKMDTLYYHAWCKYEDLPDVKDNDVLEVNGVAYGIIEVAPDEFDAGVNLFLQKV